MSVFPVVVFDLDNTLCDCNHRSQFAKAKDWDAFHAASIHDPPHLDVLHLWNSLPASTRRVVITGRNEAFRKITEDWLKRHFLYQTCDVLLMRPDNDKTPDKFLKLKLLLSLFGNDAEKTKKEVAFILDDKADVVEAYRCAGFNCWQVRGEIL